MLKDQLIKAKLEELPEELKKEVLDYIEFWLQRYGKKAKKRKFRFDWEGGLIRTEGAIHFCRASA